LDVAVDYHGETLSGCAVASLILVPIDAPRKFPCFSIKATQANPIDKQVNVSDEYRSEPSAAFIPAARLCAAPPAHLNRPRDILQRLRAAVFEPEINAAAYAIV
jgi:hypothetical protein